jgi:hypothetical protein
MPRTNRGAEIGAGSWLCTTCKPPKSFLRQRQNSFHTDIHFTDQLESNLDLQHGFHYSPRRDWYAQFDRVQQARKTQKLIAFATRLQS